MCHKHCLMCGIELLEDYVACMRHHGHALCRYTLTLHLSLEKGKPPDRQAITGLVCTTVAGAALLRTSGAETVRLLQPCWPPQRLQACATSSL